MNKLDIWACGLAFGVLWSSSVFLLGILSMSFNWGTKLVEIFSSLYKGYKPTVVGSLIGAVWGFADGIIGGVLIALLYNAFVK